MKCFLDPNGEELRLDEKPMRDVGGLTEMVAS